MRRMGGLGLICISLSIISVKPSMISVRLFDLSRAKVFILDFY